MIKNYIASHHMYIHNCLRRCSIRKYNNKKNCCIYSLQAHVINFIVII